MKDKTKRVEAIEQELDRAAEDYVEAKNEFEGARVRFGVARERFASIKRLAAAMLPSWEFYEWQGNHPNVQYAASPIGEAILSVLQGTAYSRALQHLEKKKGAYWPWMSMDSIIDTLESGGFDFRTTTPAREVNAALIRLEGVRKHEKKGVYAIENAGEILENLTKVYEEALPEE